MYQRFLSIHKNHTLASIANRIDKCGFVIRGDWTVKGNYHTVVDNLIRLFKEAEKEIKNKQEDKYL